MSISFKGLGENVITFKTTNAVAGQPVTVSANDTVAKSVPGDSFCGIATTVADGYAGVQLSGYVEATFTGTAPTLGYGILVANGTGGVKTATAGRNVLIVNVNTSKTTVGFIL